MSDTPIGDYALLSDRHSAALVGRDGSVDWLCFPRFDSPSVFARLLDDDAGHWSVRPSVPYEMSRRYVEQTMVLETTFRTATGTVTLTDALLAGPDDGGHRLGVGAPHVLVRQIACAGGPVPVEVEYRPRPEYGLIAPILSRVEGGVTARGGAEWLVLTAPVRMEIGTSVARATFTLGHGETLHFGLHRSTLEETPARVWPRHELAARLESTVAAWRSWSALHQAYEGAWRDLVHQSGRVLQALSFQPSGAIVAAATTSLPETVGGERNWDYRYAWIRDASLTLQALYIGACSDEAEDFVSFMTSSAGGRVMHDAPLQIMYGIGGEHDLS
ncbi:MAG: glycoside hydrolase family 15 protein, partial [Actinoallomurus sp.]